MKLALPPILSYDTMYTLIKLGQNCGETLRLSRTWRRRRDMAEKVLGEALGETLDRVLPQRMGEFKQGWLTL